MWEWRYSSIILDLNTRYRRVSGQLHALAALRPGGNGSDTRWIGDWVGPRDDLDAVEQKTSLATTENRTPDVQPSPSLYWLSYPGSYATAVPRKRNAVVYNRRHLTKCGRFLQGKLTVVQLLKIFQTVYGIRSFIAVFRRFRRWFLP
jgi:hypothetical protein